MEKVFLEVENKLVYCFIYVIDICDLNVCLSVVWGVCVVVEDDFSIFGVLVYS